MDLHALARDAMLQRGLLPDFPPAARDQSEAITGPHFTGAGAVRDLRRLLWCSIDNDDSRDLDQLSVAQDLGGGTVQVMVAIADVDALVPSGTPIDQHAGVNTTSVYTAGGVFPMLPLRLSTDLTSLNHGEERLAVVVDMTITSSGGVAESDVYQAVVKNHARLAYDAVAAWLDGTGPIPPMVAAVPGLQAQIRLQDGVAQALKQLRHRRGAVSLSTPQARPVFEQGVLVDLRPDMKNRAKELISDFMIAANGVSARFLDRHGFPSIRRYLQTPRRWERIVDIAAALGEALPVAPSSLALDAFLARRREADPARFEDLSLSIVKLLGSGQYTVATAAEAAAGHFGLAVNDYTHATAPNRRYPDLVTQRLLKAAIAREAVPYSDAQLAALAEHCTKQEDNAGKVERQVRKSAAAVLLRGRIGQRFSAIVTGANDKGTWVRISQPTAEGRVVGGFEGLDVGDKIEVELVDADVPQGFIDFVRAA